MAVAAKKRGRKPGQKSTKQNYSVAGLLTALREGDVNTRRDAVKRYPLFATASLEEILGSMSDLSARKVEKWLGGAGAEVEEVEQTAPKNKPASNGNKPKGKPGRPKKITPPVDEDEDEDAEDDEDEEEPPKRKAGRPKGSTNKAKSKKVSAPNKKGKRSADDDDDDDVASVLDDEDEDEEDDEDDDEEDDDED